MAGITELAGLIRQGLAEDERIAREACGGTVVGEAGNWRQAPEGDEWVAEQEDDFVSLLVALRPGLKRSDPESAGYWGAVVEWQDDGDEPDARGPLDAFVHAARRTHACTDQHTYRTGCLMAPDWSKPILRSEP